uniref:Photosystem I assembly protein Ycf4 n=1 Tax=Passiflora cerradensis TaxID=1052166 RepID=A0A7H0TWT1_9ROSI|nr:Ycf4 [Passiflora cerradensis]QNR05483.1 Ycf4 [Passiflora cerradensis]
MLDYNQIFQPIAILRYLIHILKNIKKYIIHLIRNILKGLVYLWKSQIQRAIRIFVNALILAVLLRVFLETLKNLLWELTRRFYLVDPKLPDDWEPPSKSPAIILYPQAVLVFFYDDKITGRFVRFFSWVSNLWNENSDSDQFVLKNKQGIACFFRWGFPGPYHRMSYIFFMKDIMAVRIHFRVDALAYFILFLEVRGTGSIPLLRTYFASKEDFLIINERAEQIANFLDIPIEESWFI